MVVEGCGAGVEVGAAAGVAGGEVVAGAGVVGVGSKVLWSKARVFMDDSTFAQSVEKNECMEVIQE